MKHIKKMILVSVLMLFVGLIIPTVSETLKPLSSSTVVLHSDLPEKD
jgi:hypothetical protein